MKVIVFGATGMVGEGVLHIALRDAQVEQVLVVGRRSCGVQHPKLTEIVHGDFFDFSPVAQQLKGYDACFFCLGVSSVGMSEADYRRTTYDLTMHVANTLVALNPGMAFCYVSGMGTDSTEQGRLMWARVKGKTENDLRKLPFRAVYCFRPGFIRPMEGMRNTLRLVRLLGWTYPFWKRVAPGTVCTLEDVGRAMINVAQRGYPTTIVESRDIARLAASV